MRTALMLMKYGHLYLVRWWKWCTSFWVCFLLEFFVSCEIWFHVIKCHRRYNLNYKVLLSLNSFSSEVVGCQLGGIQTFKFSPRAQISNELRTKCIFHVLFFLLFVWRVSNDYGMQKVLFSLSSSSSERWDVRLVRLRPLNLAPEPKFWTG